MTVEEVATFVEGESHGRITAWIALGHADAMANYSILILMLLGLIVVLVAMVGLIDRERYRDRALAMMSIVAALAPLLALGSAAYDAMNGLVYLIDNPPGTNSSVVHLNLLAGAATLLFGAMVGALAVVARAVLMVVRPKAKAPPA